MRTYRSALSLVLVTAVLGGCGGTAATASPQAPTPGATTTTTAPSAGTTTAPSASAGPELSGTISFLEKYPATAFNTYIESVVSAFEALHPKVKINLQAVGDQPIKDTLRVLASADMMPDIYFAWPGLNYTNLFAQNGLALDLTSYITNTDWGKTFIPSALQAYTYNGKLYGIPWTLDAKYMVYNKDIFAANGITVPTTLSQLVSDCDTLAAKGIQGIDFGNVNEWPVVHYVTQLNTYFVPPATLTQDYNPATATWADPGYITALEWLQKLNTHCFPKGANGTTYQVAEAAFTSGKSAMSYEESLSFISFTAKGGAPAGFDTKWDFFQLPTEPGAAGSATTEEGAPDGFLVNPKSEHIDIDIAFLQFLTNQANAAQLVAATGYLSPVLGTATSANTFPQTLKVVTQLQSTTNMAIWLDTVTQTYVATAYLDGATALIGGTKTPAQVMDMVKAASAKAKAGTSPAP